MLMIYKLTEHCRRTLTSTSLYADLHIALILMSALIRLSLLPSLTKVTGRLYVSVDYLT